MCIYELRRATTDDFVGMSPFPLDNHSRTAARVNEGRRKHVGVSDLSLPLWDSHGITSTLGTLLQGAGSRFGVMWDC